MEYQTVLFYMFSTILMFAALRVIIVRNLVHATLFLVLAFFSAASIWILLNAEFLAIVLLLVYVGAVMVLFLFVVMMLDVTFDKIRLKFWNDFSLIITISTVIMLELATVLLHNFWILKTQVPIVINTSSNAKLLGMLIYTDYVFAFEIAGIILLLAIIAAVALTLRRRKDAKYLVSKKIKKINKNNHIRLVKMTEEKNISNTLNDKI